MVTVDIFYNQYMMLKDIDKSTINSYIYLGVFFLFSPTDISDVDLLSRNNFERSIDSDHESPAAPAKRRFKRVLSDEEEDN